MPFNDDRLVCRRSSCRLRRRWWTARARLRSPRLEAGSTRARSMFSSRSSDGRRTPRPPEALERSSPEVRHRGEGPPLARPVHRVPREHTTSRQLRRLDVWLDMADAARTTASRKRVCRAAFESSRIARERAIIAAFEEGGGRWRRRSAFPRPPARSELKAKQAAPRAWSKTRADSAAPTPAHPRRRLLRRTVEQLSAAHRRNARQNSRRAGRPLPPATASAPASRRLQEAGDRSERRRRRRRAPPEHRGHQRRALGRAAAWSACTTSGPPTACMTIRSEVEERVG